MASLPKCKSACLIHSSAQKKASPGRDGLPRVAARGKRRLYRPIIVMTAHGPTETAIRATKLGAFDYLPKPFDMEELIELLAKAIASARLRPQPVELGDAPAASD